MASKWRETQHGPNRIATSKEFTVGEAVPRIAIMEREERSIHGRGVDKEVDVQGIDWVLLRVA